MSTIRLTREFTFEMAHALAGYDGPCSQIHGHSYRLFVTVRGVPSTDPADPKLGMVMDFGVLKEVVNRLVISRYDHALVLRATGSNGARSEEMCSDTAQSGIEGSGAARSEGVRSSTSQLNTACAEAVQSNTARSDATHNAAHSTAQSTAALIDSLRSSFERIVVVPFQPTCENLLADFAAVLIAELPPHVTLYSLRLHETASSYAEWLAEEN